MSKQQFEYLGKRMELIKHYREDLKLESNMSPKINYEFMKNNINEAVEEMKKEREIELRLKEARNREYYNCNLKNVIKDITEKLNNWKKCIQNDKLIYITFKSDFYGVKKDIEDYLVSEDGLNIPKKHIRIEISVQRTNKDCPYWGRIYITFD